MSATPALLTLASQPALGAGVTCFTPSRSLSKNTSVGQELKNGECNGVSPGNYGAKTDPNQPGGSYNWPDPPEPQPDTPFHDVFSGYRFSITVISSSGSTGGKSKKPRVAAPSTRSLTFLEVLRLNPTSTFPDLADGVIPVDPANIGKHIAAAYLNCVNGFIPTHILTTDQVKAIWTEWDTKTYFEPMAGVKWYEADIVDYLTSNGIAP